MPYVTILILGISAGIAGYAGLTHLLIGAARRPRDATQLLFGLLSLSVAAHTLVVLALLDVRRPSSVVSIDNGQIHTNLV